MRQEETVRVERVIELLLDLKREFHPFQGILDELDLTPSSFSEHSFSPSPLDQTSSPPLSMLDSPFPGRVELLGWDCIKEIYEARIPAENVEQEFSSRKSKIKQKILEWRAETEIRLAKIFQGDHKNYVEVGRRSLFTITPFLFVFFVQVNKSTSSLGKLSEDVQFLLRADTIFRLPLPRIPDSSWQPKDKENDLHYYPDCLLVPEQPEQGRAGYAIHPVVDLRQHMRHTEAEKIVKPLLENLGIPDVAYIELKALGESSFAGGATTERQRLGSKWRESHF